MGQTQLEYEVDLQDVSVNWEGIARVLAGQLARSTDFDELLERMEREASYRMRRAWANPEDESPNTQWESPYAAAMLLRHADEETPGLRDHRDTERMLRELRKQQLTEAEAEREDVIQQVLISPRQRQNVIERIVHTFGGRVFAEFWHETGWRRYTADLRNVLTGTPLPARASEALSRQPGLFDTLPTEECLARMKELDPHATVSGPHAGAALGGAIAVPYYYTKLPDVATATVRITEAEVLDDARADDLRFSGSDVTNAALAAELLFTTRAIWR